MKEIKQIAESYAVATRVLCDIFVAVVMMILPVLAGAWLDCRIGIPGIFVIIGSILGFVGGIYFLIKALPRRKS